MVVMLAKRSQSHQQVGEAVLDPAPAYSEGTAHIEFKIKDGSTFTIEYDRAKLKLKMIEKLGQPPDGGEFTPGQVKEFFIRCIRGCKVAAHGDDNEQKGDQR